METIEYKGYTIKIEQDEYTESPREWDNVGTMVCFHRRYTLGDKHEFKTPDDFKEFIENNKKIVILPIYMYDHSGISISTSNDSYPFNCRWDSGQIGFIYVSYEKLRKEYNRKNITKKFINDTVLPVLQGEVDTYNKYLNGEVYEYAVYKGDDLFDSCGGFYGQSDAITDAKSMVHSYVKTELPLLAHAGILENTLSANPN